MTSNTKTSNNDNNINSYKTQNVVLSRNDMSRHMIPSSSFTQYSLRLLDRENKESTTTTNTYSTSCCYNTFKINPPFDSAMALTVLVLLTALFFMGFFSIYIRRFADENNVDPTRRRRRAAATAAAAVGYLSRGGGGGKKGVDPAVVQSLPVYVYSGGDVEQGIKNLAGKGSGNDVECAICLSEFKEREWVKEIPYCGHVFHVECIDTWLNSHVTCPLCRTTEFFLAEKKDEETEKRHVADVGEVRGSEGSSRGGGERDTCREVSVRRTSSCSWYGERVTLHRSLSF